MMSQGSPAPGAAGWGGGGGGGGRVGGEGAYARFHGSHIAGYI